MTEYSNKRKYDEVDNINDDDEYVLYKTMIYSRKNEVHFTAGINNLSIEFVIKEISKIIDDFYDKNDVGESLTVTYVVDSGGGSVSSILKFVDYLHLVKGNYPNVTFVSVATGSIASAATIMCIVADKRYITKHAKAMIHNLSASYNGTYTKLMSYGEHLKDVHKTLIGMYVPKFKGSQKKLERLLKCEKWFSAEEYLKFGFVDEIK